MGSGTASTAGRRFASGLFACSVRRTGRVAGLLVRTEPPPRAPSSPIVVSRTRRRGTTNTRLTRAGRPLTASRLRKTPACAAFIIVGKACGSLATMTTGELSPGTARNQRVRTLVDIRIKIERRFSPVQFGAKCPTVTDISIAGDRGQLHFTKHSYVRAETVVVCP